MSCNCRYYAHPTAVVESEDIGEQTKIWHFAHVRRDSKIGRNCNIGKSVYIDIGTEIGDNVKIQNFVSVYKGVRIEDDVFIGPSATFTNDLFPRAFVWDEDHVVPTQICRGASIGANATLVCGIKVGEYAMIGAGSVVAAATVGATLVPARLGSALVVAAVAGAAVDAVVADFLQELSGKWYAKLNLM